MNRSVVILMVFLVMLFVPVKAMPQSQPVFKKIGLADGLSNGRVTSIVKEKDGFVWIATKNGLNRYDGLEFKVYNKQNSNIGSNDISDLFIDSNNRLWVATLGGGLNLYNAQLDEFIIFKNQPNNKASIPSNHVNTIYEDNRGKLWLGTEAGLSSFSNGVFKSFSHEDGPNAISHNSVTSICQSQDSGLWVGTFGGGLNKFSFYNERFEQIDAGTGMLTAYIHSLACLADGQLLVGTSGGGLLALNITTKSFSKYLGETIKIDQEVNIVRSIAHDGEGNLWVGTDGNGIYKIENPTGTRPVVAHYMYNAQLQSSLSGNAVYEIMEDGDANIWIGTAWNGVNILNRSQNFEFFFSDIKGENPSPVLSLYKSEDKLFLGLDGNGLTVFNTISNEVKYFNRNLKTAIGGNYIQHILEGGQGDFWLGSFANGLIHFNESNGSYRQYKFNPKDSSSLSYNDVRYLLKEADGGLWVATWGGGLNYFDPRTKSFRYFRESAGNTKAINSDNVISLQRDNDKIWVATFGGGLDLFDPDTGVFSHFEHSETDSNTPSSNNIFSLYKDSRGYLWIGTSGEGINRFDPETGKFDRFEHKENIRYATVTGIVEDDSGNIWFSTKDGIFNFDYAQNQFNSFPNLSGEFHINSVFKDGQGQLYFGGINGVLKFDPEAITYENKQPKVKLTNFKLFNKATPIGPDQILKQNIAFEEELVLRHNLDVITFEFAALNFPFSQGCEYAIKMENFDDDWRTIGKDRTATFTNLAPGDYTFKVKSRLPGAEWGSDFTAIKLQILTPFWLRWWAFALYALLIIGLFYLFRKYIVAWEQMKANLQLEKLTHEKDTELYNLKQQFFTNISHEIRTPVTLILSSINRLVESVPNEKGYKTDTFGVIKRHSNRLLNLVNELLDFKKFDIREITLNITEGDWLEFCREVQLSFSELAFQKNIELKFSSSLSKIPLWFDKNQMEKVLYNLLSNAFKFTEKGGIIEVEVLANSAFAELRVKDTGVGVSEKKLSKIFNRFYQSDNSQDIEDKGFGLGLSIAKEVVELHHGSIDVESEKGVGSTFIIKLKRGNDHFTDDEMGEAYDSELLENYLLEHSTAETIEPHSEELFGKTLLIIEDNPDIRKYLVGLFVKDCKVIEAQNGQEGFKRANTFLPDLIVSDIMMPIMDGVSLTRKLKSDMRTSHIPIILLTARASLIHKMEGFDTGADDYITKPFNEALLKQRIKNLIRSRKTLREKFGGEGLFSTSDLAANNTDKAFLDRLIKAIHDHLDSEDLSANFLSKELGMSHSVIYKKTKALTGMTFVEFVRDFKLITAKRLIAENNFTISEASDKVGYADRKYFSRLFKQKFGKNPSDFYQG